MQNNPLIAIIGAGPVGLLAAINLAKHGVHFRIFEEKYSRVNLSKALAVHAGTLEYLEETHPLLLKIILDAGKKAQKMKLGNVYQLDVSRIPSKYNFVLILEQQKIEAILEEYLAGLGVKVERSCRLITAENFPDFVNVTIEKNKDQFSTPFTYLIDCSGAHSLIRKEVLKLPFIGEKYFGQIVMGDVKVISEFEDLAVSLNRSPEGIAGLVPLNEKKYCRLILIPANEAEIPSEISMNYFSELVKKIAPNIKLSGDYHWLTKFEISRRMTPKLHVGRIFLAGDSAHVHSPVGGQGMNIGMQDALNISSKLVRVLIKIEDEKLLDDYEKQRLPIIKKVLKLTNAAMRMGIEKSFFNRLKFFFLSKIIAPIFFSSGFLQKRLLITISQIKSARQEISWLKK